MKKQSKQATFNRKIKEYKNFLKEDEDWDWHYIIRLLKYKLERTRKCIVSNRIILEAPRVAKEIREVEILLDRVLKDRYHEEVFKNFDKKYGKPKLISGKPDPKTGHSMVTIHRAKVTPKNEKAFKSEFKKLVRKEDQMRQADLNRAFDLMKKNIWGWWD